MSLTRTPVINPSIKRKYRHLMIFSSLAALEVYNFWCRWGRHCKNYSWISATKLASWQLSVFRGWANDALCALRSTITSWYGNDIRITGPLWGNPSMGGRFPSQRASSAEALTFFLSLLSWINCSTNSWIAGYLRRLDTHVAFYSGIIESMMHWVLRSCVPHSQQYSIPRIKRVQYEHEEWSDGVTH